MILTKSALAAGEIEAGHYPSTGRVIGGKSSHCSLTDLDRNG
ncbi:hypothetical protein [Parafrankia sp. EAN1pec]